MMTVFWILFFAALAILAVCLFLYLLIPIIVIGLLILAFNACEGNHGRRVVETTHSNSAESARNYGGNRGTL